MTSAVRYQDFLFLFLGMCLTLTPEVLAWLPTLMETAALPASANVWTLVFFCVSATASLCLWLGSARQQKRLKRLVEDIRKRPKVQLPDNVVSIN